MTQSPDDPVVLRLVPCPSPRCDSLLAEIAVRSATIVTFRCLACGTLWSAEVAGLPEVIRMQVKASGRRRG